MLRATEEPTQRSAAILEKDIWICWALRTLFRLPEAPQMAFKGGTSLSKIYRAIDRFSEDVDITIDYKSLSPDFDPFATDISNTKRKTQCEALQGKVISLLHDRIAPFFAERLKAESRDPGRIEIVDKEEAIRVNYPSALGGSAKGRYLTESVLMEFGGRNTTQPMERHVVSPYISGHTVDLFFPTAEVSVLAGERTFWEKATLIHVECNRDDFEARVSRKSRHWYDLVKLAAHAVGARALADPALLVDVVKHKKVFYHSAKANYDDCLQGRLQLVPPERSRRALEEDYQKMIDEGMFEGVPPSVTDLLDRISDLEKKVNVAHAIATPSRAESANIHND